MVSSEFCITLYNSLTYSLAVLLLVSPFMKAGVWRYSIAYILLVVSGVLLIGAKNIKDLEYARRELATRIEQLQHTANRYRHSLRRWLRSSTITTSCTTVYLPLFETKISTDFSSISSST